MSRSGGGASRRGGAGRRSATRQGAAPGDRRGGAGERRRRRRLLQRLQSGLLVVSLVGAGVLLGSFWLEWRHTRLASPPAELEADPPSLGEGGEPVRVEVLNGSGEPGAARSMADWLRDSGFDVVTYGNAASFGHTATAVLDRSGREGAAAAVADSLGIAGAASEPKPELYLDATVILGSDWRRLLAVRDSVRRAQGVKARRRPF